MSRRATQSYEEWCESIRRGWQKDAEKNARHGRKIDRAIALGEYTVEGSYPGRDGRTIRILRKVTP